MLLYASVTYGCTPAFVSSCYWAEAQPVVLLSKHRPSSAGRAKRLMESQGLLIDRYTDINKP
jgi:hypothetical protein